MILRVFLVFLVLLLSTDCDIWFWCECCPLKSNLVYIHAFLFFCWWWKENWWNSCILFVFHAWKICNQRVKFKFRPVIKQFRNFNNFIIYCSFWRHQSLEIQKTLGLASILVPVSPQNCIQSWISRKKSCRFYIAIPWDSNSWWKSTLRHILIHSFLLLSLN